MATPRAKPAKTPASPDLDSLLAEAALPETTVPVCLRAQLVAEFGALEVELQESRAKTDTMAAKAATRRLAEQVEALQERMREGTVTFRLRALPRPKRLALNAEHPARKDHEDDKAAGHNVDTFPLALIRASVIEPEFTPGQWDRLLDDVLSDGQLNELANTAWLLTTGQVRVPSSYAASAILRTSDETSQPPSA